MCMRKASPPRVELGPLGASPCDLLEHLPRVGGGVVASLDTRDGLLFFGGRGIESTRGFSQTAALAGSSIDDGKRCGSRDIRGSILRTEWLKYILEDSPQR